MICLDHGRIMEPYILHAREKEKNRKKKTKIKSLLLNGH
uniref:Uncharacterized protein n=1 Tax=Rhizophora mucronata TaxID=61149 RepID=A0A2P2NN25_RHIMU